MNIPKEFEKEFAGFPAVLQALVLAELEAGNSITALSHGFPAAPCGAYLMLARPVSSSKRAKTAELVFYDRDTNSYAGEFTDAQRHYFVLEPPRPPAPPPDSDQPAEEHTVMAEEIADPNSILARFKASMVIDFDKWHDGIGYDLGLIAQAAPEEKKAIEDLLIQRNTQDWRDVEAMAALDSDPARAALLAASTSSDAQVRMAVHAHAPELLSEPQRIASLVEALEHEHLFGGLTAALSEVETFHPPAVISTLLRGLMEREGEVACHFAAMLYFLHGKASSSFDMEHRPFFLRFNTNDHVEREKAVRELCITLGVDPGRSMKPDRASSS